MSNEEWGQGNTATSDWNLSYEIPTDCRDAGRFAELVFDSSPR